MSMSVCNMSLFIPHVFVKHSSAKFVAHVFEKLHIGIVEHVEFLPKFKNDRIANYDICVHFYHWYDNVATRNLQKKIRSPTEEAKIVYDDPWYWTIYENGVMKKEIVDVPLTRKPIIRYEKKKVICLDESKQQDFEKNILSYGYGIGNNFEEILSKHNIKLTNHRLEEGEEKEDTQESYENIMITVGC